MSSNSIFHALRGCAVALALTATPLVSLAGAQGSTSGSAADRQAVLATIDEFLRGLRTKDTALMSRHVDTLSRFTLLRPSPNGGTRVVVLKASEFIRVVSNPDQPAFDEPIRNPQVHIDADLASVWAEYQVRREGTVTHCGYDAFHLARLGGQWKILNVSDTFRQTGCGTAWPATNPR
ncbi:MAG TPA: nuclear transport factor 2 family protein [Gemmatimonadaceae bacterium]|nr:nuclear transport factor 2 family protein [Gemmatimonadaceae bacterium]